MVEMWTPRLNALLSSRKVERSIMIIVGRCSTNVGYYTNRIIFLSFLSRPELKVLVMSAGVGNGNST